MLLVPMIGIALSNSLNSTHKRQTNLRSAYHRLIQTHITPTTDVIKLLSYDQLN